MVNNNPKFKVDYNTDTYKLKVRLPRLFSKFRNLIFGVKTQETEVLKKNKLMLLASSISAFNFDKPFKKI